MSRKADRRNLEKLARFSGAEVGGERLGYEDVEGLMSGVVEERRKKKRKRKKRRAESDALVAELTSDYQRR